MDPHGPPPTIIPHPHLPGYSYPPPGMSLSLHIPYHPTNCTPGGSIHHPPPMPGQPGVPPPQQPDMDSMEGLEGQLHNGGPPQDGQQLQGDSGSGSSAQGTKGRRKKDQHSAEDWTRIRKDNHVSTLTSGLEGDPNAFPFLMHLMTKFFRCRWLIALFIYIWAPPFIIVHVVTPHMNTLSLSHHPGQIERG